MNDKLTNDDVPIVLWITDELDCFAPVVAVERQLSDDAVAEAVRQVFVSILPIAMEAGREVRLVDNLDRCLFHSVGRKVIFPPPEEVKNES